MPEDKYSFKATPEVQSFGELMGHVANAAYFFCSSAAGEENPNKTNFEEVSAKADLVAAVKGAFEYCDAAYAMSDEKAMEDVTLFGQSGNRLWVLVFNVAHSSQHYGNVVTYFRLNGMVPPSSQGGM